jgi:hypothetical protein
VPQHNHIGAPLFLLISEEAALLQINVIDQRLLLGVSLEHRVLYFAALVLKGEAAQAPGR